MTLTQVATLTRRSIIGLIVFLILGISTFIFVQVREAQRLASIPKPEDKPDVKYGVLPKPDFLPPNVSSSNFSYQIATQTGGLPDFGKIAKVFFIPKATASFLAKDKASTLAQKFNFDSSPEATAESYQFKKDKKILTLDINTGNFKYRVEATSSGNKIADNQYISNFRTFLSVLGILAPELKNGPAKIGNGIVNLWPGDVDNKPIVTANFKKSLVTAEASNSAINSDDYFSLDYIFWPVDNKTFSTYPIKTASLALEDLKKGLGTIIISPKNPQISITSAYLAYFESENYNPYLLPVIVFEGPNFVAFVPAVTDQYSTH